MLVSARLTNLCTSYVGDTDCTKLNPTNLEWFSMADILAYIEIRQNPLTCPWYETCGLSDILTDILTPVWDSCCKERAWEPCWRERHNNLGTIVLKVSCELTSSSRETTYVLFQCKEDPAVRLYKRIREMLGSILCRYTGLRNCEFPKPPNANAATAASFQNVSIHWLRRIYIYISHKNNSKWSGNSAGHVQT